ncbi:Gfo/Idh/MocA family protein [Streptomyces sp. NPDC002523]
MRALLVGAGEVGVKHLTALHGVPGIKLCAVADPVQQIRAGIPLFAGHRGALAAMRPDLVVVATPPGMALTIARQAAATGALVLVEKPATLHPEDLTPRPGDERIYVAFQPHFAPGMDRLIINRPPVISADVLLTCRRDAAYFRTWRRSPATAGGILHQQAIHGLALALKVMGPHPVTGCQAETFYLRALAETEDRIHAYLRLAGGRTLTVTGRVDDEIGPARHHVTFRTAGGGSYHVRGRNLEAGCGPASAAPTHEQLRALMYRALRDVHQGAPAHPCLFPLPALHHTLEVITHVYRAAERHTGSSAA